MPCGVPHDSPVNLVAGDEVAGFLAVLAEQGGEGDFNLVSPSPWRAGDLLRIAAGLAGARDPAPQTPASLSPLLNLAAEELARHYAEYLGVNPSLDTSSADRLRAQHGLPRPENDAAWIEAILRWAVRRNWEEL